MSFLDNLPGFIYKYRLLSNGLDEFIFASSKISHIFGISSQEVLQDIHSIKKLIHVDDIHYLQKAIQESANNLSPLHIEYRVNHPTKGELWIENHASVKENIEEECIEWYGIALDITKQKLLAKAFLDKHSNYNKIYNTSKDIIYLVEVTKEGRFIHRDLNRSFLEITSTLNENLLDKYVDELTDKAFKKVLTDKYNHCLYHEKEIDYKWEYTFPKRKKIFHSTLSPIYDEQGNIYQIVGIARDITEKEEKEILIQNKEKEIQESKNFLDKIIDSIPDPIFVKDKNHQWVIVNESLSKLTGIPKDDFIGKSDYDFFPKEEADIFWEKDEKVFQSGKIDINEETITSINGIPHDIETVKIKFNTDEDNNYIVGTIRDITQRKKQEELLRQTIKEYQTLAENIPDNIARWDTKGHYTYLNSIHLKTLGVKSIDEVLGKHFSELIPYFTEIDNAIQSILQKEQNSVTLTQNVLKKNKKDEIHEIIFVPEKDAKGEIVGILGIGRDITQTRKTEYELSLLKFAFEHNYTPSFLMDEDGNFVHLNQAYCELQGYSVDELKTMSVFDVDPDLTKEQWIAFWQELKKSKSLHFERENTDKNKKVYPIEVDANYFEFHSKAYNVGTMRDITERKHHEKLLRHKGEEYLSLAENIPDNIARWDTKGRYIYLNSTHMKTLDIQSADEVLGKKSKEINPHFTKGNNALDSILKGEKDAITITQDLLKKDGKYEIHEVKFVAEKDAKGKLITVLGIGRDITDTVRIQEKLKQNEEKYRTLLQNVDIPIYRYGKDFKRLYVNPAVEKLAGKSASELVGKSPFEERIISHDQDNTLKQSLQKVFHSKEADSVELLFTLPDGTQKYFMHNHVPEFANDGSVESVLAIGHDITAQKELAKKEEAFRTLAEHTLDTIARYDKNGVRIYANPAFCKISGKTKEELIGTKPTTYNNTASAKHYEKTLQEVFTTGKESEIELTWYDKNENIITSLIHIVPEHDDRGNIISTLATGRDISKIKEVEKQLLKQKDFQNSLLQGVAKAGLTLSVLEDGKYIYTNNHETASEYGYDAEKISEIKPDMLTTIHPDDREKVQNFYKKRLAGEDVPNTYTIKILGAENKIEEHEISVVLVPNTKPIQTIVVAKDVTERNNREKHIEFLAHHDALTGLPNRILAKEKITLALDHAQYSNSKVAVLFLDLDDFKTINDTMGHTLGDEILKMVSNRLQSSLRSTDTISRLGGDEFLIILSEMREMNEIITISEKLLHSLKKPFFLNSQYINTSASIGISIYPEHGKSYEDLLQNADVAMYKAKENGKNDYCLFNHSIKNNLVGIFKIQNDLRDAIENNEFILHYQSQIDLAQNKIIGVEALLRWEHPTQGMIPPNDFISIAESTGLIIPIGEWIIQEVCTQAALWHKKGIKVLVAINISAIQLKKANLLKEIKKALKSSGFDPNYLELELTESILIHDTENVLETVKKIKALGVQLSIDDFGTGYSSLAYLKRFDVDKLKIDQSFVKDILKDKDDANIVKTIIQMAKSFNLKSIAEGVENQEVLNLIKEFGADEVQGYHFAKPMEAEAFEKYYKDGFV